jgi:ParB/RepB/Spo0J family partition protein
MKTIAISKLYPHPANPNVMSESNFGKLVRNIERTGLYEPIVVRPHPKNKNCFEIINGHHRVKALEKLGRKEADCVVWDIDDEQAEILLATLNRLCGSDTPSKKIELLKELSRRMAIKDLARLLPQTTKQIDRLINLKQTILPTTANAGQFPIPPASLASLVFFVTKQQQEIIERAISSIENRVSSIEMTRPQRRASALTKISECYLKVEKCQTEKT